MYELNTSEIIRRIDICIAEAGIPRERFYKESGISSASYSQWNTGTHAPTKKKLSCAARYLGVTLEYLLTGNSQKETPATETGSGGSSLSTIQGRIAFSLQDFREKAGLTQDDVAERLSRPKEEISAYERAEREADAGTMFLLLTLYNVTPLQFIESCDFQLLQPLDN